MSALSSVVYGEMEKDFFPNFLQPFLESFNLGSHNDGSLFRYFATPTENPDPLPAMDVTLEHLVKVSASVFTPRQTANPLVPKPHRSIYC